MMRFLPLVAFLALGAVFWVGLYRDGRDVLPSTLISETAPEFSLPSLLEEGETVSLASLESDGLVVLNFWASWCPPCIVEHPEITRLSKVDGVTVFGINHQDKRDKALAFLRRHGNPFTAVAFDERGRTYIDYGVTALPETFILDGKGTVLYKHVGPINPGELEEKILPVIEAARAAGS